MKNAAGEALKHLATGTFVFCYCFFGFIVCFEGVCLECD